MNAHESSNRLRVTLLGTGSPSPSLARCQPAALVQWGERGRVVVDAGDGVVAQILRSGTPLGSIEHVALTHMHWDHILGYPAFVWASWLAGRPRLQTWGPTGTADMHRRLLADYYQDQAVWGIDLGFRPEGWNDMTATDIGSGWSTVLDGCTISAAAVVHPPMTAVAYRFSHDGRSIVISGDTAMCEELIAFSTGADVLVADACASPPPADATPQRRALIERLGGFHASPQQCVDMARRAETSHLVLTHHLPEGDPSVDPDGFTGAITVGHDLLTIYT